MRPPIALLLLSLVTYVTAQQGLIPTIKAALNSGFDGNFPEANRQLGTIDPRIKAEIKAMLGSLDDAVGLDVTRHKPTGGLASGYMYLSSGLRIFFTNNAESADKLFAKSASIVKPIVDIMYSQMKEGIIKPFNPPDFFFDIFLRFICTNPRIGCTSADKDAIADKTTSVGFDALVQRVQSVPLILPPSPGGTIPEADFQDLLNALVNGNSAGASAIVGRFTPESAAAIKWATLAMGTFVGYDPNYLHPYGLFSVYDRLHRALVFAVNERNPQLAIRAINNIFILQPCLEYFNWIKPTTVDTMAAYLSKFFGNARPVGGAILDSDPKFFVNAYHSRPNNSPPATNFQQGAVNCKALGDMFQ